MKLSEKARSVASLVLYGIVSLFALAAPRELSGRLDGVVWYYQAAVLFGVVILAAGISLAVRRRGGSQQSPLAIIPLLLLAGTWYVVIRHRSVWPVWAWLPFPVVTFVMVLVVSPFGRRRSEN